MKYLPLSLIMIALFTIAGCSRKSGNETLKVMTLNIRYDNPGDSLNGWSNREEQICSFIKEEKPAIIGMQEVLWHQYELLDSVLTAYASEGIGREDGVHAGEMNPVFYRKDRFELARKITFWLSETPEIAGSKSWGSSLPRIVTWVELVEKESHRHIFIFNTHFAHDSDTARIMSSKLLLKEIEKAASESPFIVTGDFNMERTSKGYEVLTGPDESVPLIKDSYVITQKKPGGPAYTFNGFFEKQGSQRIDFIFVKNGMKVLSHNTFVRKKDGVFISDHWPVEAVISLSTKDLIFQEKNNQ